MSHQEKQRIFDEYAQKQGYQKWEDLVMFSGFTFSGRLALINHMYNACDLVQEEQQKRIAEKALIRHDYNDLNNLDAGRSQKRFFANGLTYYTVDESSIINPENLIK